MAGGINAEFVACSRCAKKAKRISEGIEDDSYECTVCGHKFAIHWISVLQEKKWPISKQEAEEILKMWKYYERQKKST